MGHCGVKYKDPRSAGLANWDKYTDPDAFRTDAGWEGSLGKTGCCANVSSVVTTIARTPMAHVAIWAERIMDGSQHKSAPLEVYNSTCLHLSISTMIEPLNRIFRRLLRSHSRTLNSPDISEDFWKSRVSACVYRGTVPLQFVWDDDSPTQDGAIAQRSYHCGFRRAFSTGKRFARKSRVIDTRCLASDLRQPLSICFLFDHQKSVSVS